MGVITGNKDDMLALEPSKTMREISTSCHRPSLCPRCMAVGVSMTVDQSKVFH